MARDGGQRSGARRIGRPDFRQLEIFLKVAETRSFAEAARKLDVSQPAVSQSIARLEELYGGDLFERRRGAPVALTPIGKAILPSAKLLLFTVDQQINRALATAQSTVGTLFVGFYPGLAHGPLSAGIAEFSTTRPHVQLRLVEASPSELYRQLNDRLVDIIFVALLPDLAGGGNMQEGLWKEHLMVVMRDDHPLATKESLRWDDLSASSIILRSHQGDLAAYRAIAARFGDRQFKCDLHDVSRSVLVEMVKVGIGVTITYSSAAVPRDGIVYRPISDKNAQISVDAIWPKDDRNPLRHRLLSCVRQHAVKTQNAICDRPSGD
jgi:LysR family hydrogen peroxide-inducible transcriptional activator